MALELRSQWCIFENSTKCNEMSFDPHSFSAKRSIRRITSIRCPRRKYTDLAGSSDVNLA